MPTISLDRKNAWARFRLRSSSYGGRAALPALRHPSPGYRHSLINAPSFPVTGSAGGSARVRFGGDHGQELNIKAGDVAILPAGTGHQCIKASNDFCVIGAYPPGAKMEITRATPENHAKALKTIPQVALPPADPVTGKDGALMRLWR